MPIAEWVAVQTSGLESQSGNPPAGYIAVILSVIVVGLVVRIIIRSNPRRSSKQ